MAFEDLLRVQAYVRGDGRNYMAEAIRQRGKRQEDLEDREQRRKDVFESQRRSQEFQERLVEKNNDAYLSRLKKIQEMKLQSSYPKKPGETDDQWQERVGKAQAEPVNRLFEDASDARKRAGQILKEQATRKQGEVLKRARIDEGFLSTIESLDKTTANAIRGGASPEAAIKELAKKKKDKAAQALSAYEATISRYAGTDDRGNPLVPDATPQAIEEYNSLREAEKMASEQATLLINTYQRDGDFKGAPYIKSIARELLGPRVTGPDGGEGSLKPEDFRPSKTKTSPSMGGSTGAEATPANGPGAGASPPSQSGAPFSFPGRGVVPTFLNEALPWARENVLPPIEAGAAEALRMAGVAGRNIKKGPPAYRYLFSGEQLEPMFAPGTLPVPVPVPPMSDAELGGALREPVRSAPLAANVTVADLQEFMANELGMDFSQIDQHFQEKAQGNPEAAEAEQEILSQIMRRRAILPPGQPVLMR